MEQEVVIAILLSILVAVFLIYLTYFSIKSFRVKKQRVQEGDADAALSPTGRKGLTIGLVVYFALAAALFGVKLVFATGPQMGDSYWVSVNSSSMASDHTTNAHINRNGHNEKIYVYELASFRKVAPENLEIYSVILFEKNGTKIAHRIVTDPTQPTFKTQGDANPDIDPWDVTAGEVLGVYAGEVPFLSFMNYLSYTPGFYIVWGGATAAIGICLFFEVKDNLLRKHAMTSIQ